MPRIRTVKPAFFKHEGLFDLEHETKLPIRVAFAGLWTCCDREGRFLWRPRQLKTDILPYDDVDFSRVLDALATRGFVVRYASGGEDFGHIPSWPKHQVVNHREAASVIPPPPGNPMRNQEIRRDDDACPTGAAHVPGAPRHARGEQEQEGKGTEENPCEPDGSPGSPPKKNGDGRHQAVVQFYSTEFEKKHPGLTAPFDGSDGKALQLLLRQQREATSEDICRWLGNAFASEDVPPLGSGWRLRQFCAHFARFVDGPVRRNGRANGHAASLQNRDYRAGFADVPDPDWIPKAEGA